MRRKRTALIILILLAALIAIPVGLTWQQVRQEQLNHALIEAVKRNDTAAVVAMLRNQADANARDEPLKTTSVWQVLVDRFRGRHPTPSTAPTPLQVALQPRRRSGLGSGFPPENVPLIHALLDHGARINIQPKDDYSPLAYAVLDGKNATIRLLLAHGAEVRQDRWAFWNAVETKEVQPDVVAEMIRRGGNVNDTIGVTTVLNDAIKAGRADVVRLLLAHGADYRCKDWDGATPLALARDWVTDASLSRQIVRLLKQAGARE